MDIKLTQKEIDLIKLKAEGLTHEQAATHLATNREYIREMLSSLYRKTGRRNCNALVAWATHKRLIEINL
jgi:DNA-binding CsgD family transcriptional regulator